MPSHHELAEFIWKIADILRGPYRPPQYERVMLPMTVLRRFDCVLAPTKEAVLRKYEQCKDRYTGDALDKVLNKAAGQRFHNRSPLSFEKLKGDPDNIEKHLAFYIKGFSPNVRSIFEEYFQFQSEIEKMRESNILYLVVSKFCDVDLHPDHVPNAQMGLVFENLIRRFNELANETAGDHFTPRDIIRLMVTILFINDDKLLATAGTIRKLLDPACGTGGMLAEGQNYLREHHADARLFVYGQDYNPRAFATAASDMLIKQVNHSGQPDSIRFGDIFTEDRFEGETYDYFLTNPPFGVKWEKQQKAIEDEYEKRGFAGRFGAGLPRIKDGALLFLQHMIHKFEPVLPEKQKYGSRLAIVFSGSPMAMGRADSGESNIRKWIIENDWLEAVIALPEKMFYNTDISTYIWIVTNRKERSRKGRVQLVDARGQWTPGGSPEDKKNLGDKSRHLSDRNIEDIVRFYGQPAESEKSKLFDNTDFGYTRVTVERPMRLCYQMTDERKRLFLKALPHLSGDIQAIDTDLGSEPLHDWNAVRERILGLMQERGSRWRKAELKLFRDLFTAKDPEAAPVHKEDADDRYESDPDLRDFDNVPLKEDVDAYFSREVLPYAPDAWMDRTKDKVGYEINFIRHFFSYFSPRKPADVNEDIRATAEQVTRLLGSMKSLWTPSGVTSARASSAKKTRVPWLQAVPAHWKLLPGRACFRPKMVPNTGMQESTVLSLSYGRIVVKPPEKLHGLVPASFETYQIVDPGDIICRPTDLQNDWNSLRFGIVRDRGIITSAYICLRTLEPLVREYGYLLLHTYDLMKVFYGLGSGMRQSLDWSDFKYLPCLVPSKPEQEAIVERTTREASEFLELGAAAKRIVELMKERRAALISAAVTGQIDVAGSADSR